VWHGHQAPEDGDYCVAEVPDDAPAFLVEVLGADDRPAWDDLSVTSQYRLRTRFPERVLEEVRGLHEPTEAECRRRVDLRDRLVFTIDPEDARDHDDALSVRPLDSGRWEVGIHIADVSHYVAEDGAIDLEAERRGTSCYLPAGVVPMLPERLSGDLCSLREGVDRLALSVLAELDRDGVLHGVRYEETAIRSRHRLHYGEVQEAFDGTSRFEEPLASALGTLRDLARALRARRRKAGALELEVPETKVRIDARGEPVRIERRMALESHGLIEEFMLLANRCVGEEGSRRHSGLLYRVHDPPAPSKLAELDAVLRALALPHPGSIADPARALQSLLRVHLDPPRRRLLHRMVLRSMARAQYHERDQLHFGLATRSYCHFTSPIRRYPDLHNHRRVREWLRGRRTAAWDPIALADRAVRCSATEQNATDAEREAIRVKTLRHLRGRLGEEASGIITGLIPRGMFVELDDVPAEGFVRVMEELDDQFVLDRLGIRLVGRRSRRRFTLGDSVRVVIARVDVPARECDLALAEPAGRRRRHGRR
jgi:ribonuclease R